MPVEPSKPPYRADGRLGVTPETNFFAPRIALTRVAANTKTIRRGAGVRRSIVRDGDRVDVRLDGVSG